MSDTSTENILPLWPKNLGLRLIESIRFSIGDTVMVEMNTCKNCGLLYDKMSTNNDCQEKMCNECYYGFNFWKRFSLPPVRNNDN